MPENTPSITRTFGKVLMLSHVLYWESSGPSERYYPNFRQPLANGLPSGTLGEPQKVSACLTASLECWLSGVLANELNKHEKNDEKRSKHPKRRKRPNFFPQPPSRTQAATAARPRRGCGAAAAAATAAAVADFSFHLIIISPDNH